MLKSLPYDYSNCEAVVYNNEIHILGSTYNDYKNYRSHYKWKGMDWVSVETLPFDLTRSRPIAFNGEIYLFLSDTYYYKWNGSTWTKVSNCTILSYSNPIVYNNEIHMISDSGHHKMVDDITSVEVSTVPAFVDSGSSMAVYNNEIHIVGSNSSTVEYRKYHYKWDGESWTSVSTLYYEQSRGSLVTYRNRLHVLGDYDRLRNHYIWDGVRWSYSSDLPYDFRDGSAVVCDGLYILSSWEDGYEDNFYCISNLIMTQIDK